MTYLNLRKNAGGIAKITKSREIRSVDLKNKPPNEMTDTLKGLQERVDKLEQLGKLHAQVEQAIARQNHHLGLHIKGSPQFNQICAIFRKSGISPQQAIQEACDSLPVLMEDPDIKAVRILWRRQKFASGDPGKWSQVQTADMIVSDKKAGRIEVFYQGIASDSQETTSRSFPESFQGRNGTASQNLINAVADRLSCCLGRYELQQHLKEKDAAMNELRSQFEMEKKSLKKMLAKNVEGLLLPAIQRLRKHATGVAVRYFDVLQRNTKELTTTLGCRTGGEFEKLTPREIELCNLIKNGFTAKDIAELMHVSHRTIETHRNNIRRKLGLAHKKKNLTAFLKSLPEQNHHVHRLSVL